MREFDTGATRDEDKTKPDPEGYYHPLVVEEFCRYMTKHRIQKDGETRDSDNWQQLFGSPGEHRKVCMKSLLRHVLDLWKFHRGYKGRETIKEALCAIIFNAQAYLFSILIQEEEGVFHPSLLNDKPVEPGAPIPYVDRDGLPCNVCGGDSSTGHQRLCPTLYEDEKEEK